MGIKSQLRFYCEIEYGRAFAIHQRNNYSLFMKIRNYHYLFYTQNTRKGCFLLNWYHFGNEKKSILIIKNNANKHTEIGRCTYLFLQAVEILS